MCLMHASPAVKTRPPSASVPFCQNFARASGHDSVPRARIRGDISQERQGKSSVRQGINDRQRGRKQAHHGSYRYGWEVGEWRRGLSNARVRPRSMEELQFERR